MTLKTKIEKETVALNNMVDQMGLIDIYRAFHSKTAVYTFSLGTHGTFF